MNFRWKNSCVVFALICLVALINCESDGKNPGAEEPKPLGLLETPPPSEDRFDRLLDAGGGTRPGSTLAVGQVFEPGLLLEAERGTLVVAVEEGMETRGWAFRGKGRADSSYNRYLSTDPSKLHFKAGGSYRVTFDWVLTETPDNGCETLFFSPTGVARQQWLPSINITGEVGDKGRAELRNTLLPYSDYQVIWNIVGQGGIAIDNIKIEEEMADGDRWELFIADFDPVPFRWLQGNLPVAWVGDGYFATLRVGGVKGLLRLIRADNLPPGLKLTEGGTVEGVPRRSGSWLATIHLADETGTVATLRLPLEVMANRTISLSSTTLRPQPPQPGDDPVRETWTYNESPVSFPNPLRGMRPDLDVARSHPWASLGRKSLEWNLLERQDSDTVARIRAVTDEMCSDAPSHNLKIIPRVYLIWPPDRRYWPLDLAPGDFTSPAFRQRMVRLIHRLGQAWNDDPRIAYIEMGIIGYWGEQHTPGFDPVQPDNLPSEIETLFGHAFAEAFPDKLLMHRNPRDFTDHSFGLHWDVFGSYDRGWYSNDSSLMTQELKVPLLRDRWMTAPRGGEIDPTFLDQPDWSESSQENIVRLHADRLINLIRDLHFNHLAVLNSIEPSDSELWDKAGRVERALGYRFVVTRADLPRRIEAGTMLETFLTVRNAGSSPFYYGWPLEIALLDPVTHAPRWRYVVSGTNIRTWLPGAEQTLKIQVALPAALLPGRYALAVTILDPAGMVPSVRFANRNYWNGGYTPLGIIGVGADPAPLELSGFHNLADDDSLFYLVEW